MNSKSKRRMNAQVSQDYDETKHFTSEQFPDDTFTIVLKVGGKTFSKGVNLVNDTVKTENLIGNMMQSVIDTVKSKKIKKGVVENETI
jgi:hypothetical protein